MNKFASYKFIDSNGRLRDKVVRMEKSTLKETWFDGSSFGFCPTEKSDLLLVPDLTTEHFDPIRQMRSVFCFLYNPDDRPIEKDFRFQASCIKDADEQTKGALFGVEPEFFILNGAGYPFGIANQGEFELMQQGEWYGALPPVDGFQHIRHKLVEVLEQADFEIEGVHHEVAPGQAELSWQCDNLLRTADRMVLFKYMTAAVVKSFGCHVSFEAKPFKNLNGNGCHTHQSIPAMRGVNGEKVLMAYAEGLVKHYYELEEVCCCGTTSKDRLVPGFEAPTLENNGIGWHNRTKTVRIPGNGERIEYRLPDPTMNPYICLPKMLKYGRKNVLDTLGV